VIIGIAVGQAARGPGRNGENATVRETGTKPPSRTLKARYVFPVTGRPIPGGTVTIEGPRIVAVGEGSAGGRVEDLGNVAILPGLVNAHTHLEFSGVPEPLGEPGMGFVDWIRLVIAHFRQGTGTSRESIRRGLEECGRLGTTTLGEIAQPGWPAAEFERVALDATVFLELIAPTADRVAPLLELAPRHLRAAGPSGPWRPGLSPHAPYSVLPELFGTAVSLSAAGRVPIAFHLAESREEVELLRAGSGPFRDRFEELGTCDPGLFAGAARPLDYLRSLAAAHRALVVHGNYLDEEEIGFLADHAGRMSVVYCPRTHAYFGHAVYPLEKMLAAGVTVALGTDGRASAPDLSVLAEMRFVAERYPAVRGEVVLQLGTIRAAKALGLDREVGSLQRGKLADLAIVALPDRDAADPHELLFHSDRPVVDTWCRGQAVAHVDPGTGAP
jgi:cytosine/adenosine deaminase-related metal-dependent hydrolase